MHFTIIRYFIFFSCLFLISANAFASPRTDVIYLKNGDRVTGEIKSLLRGKLEVKTDNMGTMLIDWAAILEVNSETGQSIELANGTRFYGSLDKPEAEEMLAINTAEGAVGVSALDIVSMYPVEAGFWDRLDLTANLGFSWDKSSQVGRANLGIDATWRDPRFITRGSFSSEITTQEGRPDSTRTNLDLVHMRFTKNKRFRSVFGSMEQNDELALDLRTILGAGYGWIPIRSQRSLLGMLAGLNINNEVPNKGNTETNLEMVGTFIYDYYFYSYPERRLHVNFSVFPSITDFGRFRMSIDTSFKFELFRDLFWSLSAYGSFDNEPTADGSANSDYGVTSGIGYKF
jgi:hypothetical protein